MATWEKRITNQISQVSWTDWTAMDVYYWMDHSFQYSQNINTDDEMHWIKLSTKAVFTPYYSKSQLTSLGNNWIVALDVNWMAKPTYFDETNFLDGWSTWWTEPKVDENHQVCPGVVFQDYFWYSVSWWTENKTAMAAVNVAVHNNVYICSPHDHTESTDESIEDPTDLLLPMKWAVTAILNYNNTRLVVAAWQDIWVYYPELDKTGDQQYDPNTQTIRTVVFGETGWKKVQRFEAGCQIVGLTCDFEYLKVRVTDEGWNTKMYYYPGNNDLRNTFVYNIIDMTGTKVLRTYNINGVDYFTASLDGTDSYITFNKVIGKIPIQIFTQRGGLCKYDINQKAWYFVGPTSRGAEYINGDFYVADSYGVFKFEFQPSSIDPGYLKWKVRSTAEKTIGLCIAWNFVFISDQHGIKAMRLYDTGVDWYESKGILISREMEGDFGGCVSKVLDSVKCHFELNTVISDSQDAGDIDIYMSPNNQWRNVDPESDSTGRWHVLHIDGDASKQNRNTRYEEVNELNKLNNGNPAFEFNRETIPYCVVIKSNDEEAQWTPVVREILAQYHLEGKTNDVYELTN